MGLEFYIFLSITIITHIITVHIISLYISLLAPYIAGTGPDLGAVSYPVNVPAPVMI